MRKKLFAMFIACFLPSAMFAGSGDANNDGKIDVADIGEIVNNYVLKNPDIGKIWTAVTVDTKKLWSDANVDGKIDMDDVQAIADYLMMSEAERLDRGKALSEATSDDLGSVIASDGRVYPAGTIGITPIAMIVYIGKPGTADCNSETYRGLAIALSDSEGTYDGNGHIHLNNDSGTYGSMWETMGYKKVDKEWVFDEKLCIAARNGLNVPLSYDVSLPTGDVTSGWFMPSAGQYTAFYLSYGGIEANTSHYLNWSYFRFVIGSDENSNPIYSDGNEFILADLRKAGDTSVNVNNYVFWTCSPVEPYSTKSRVIFTDFVSRSGFFISNISGENKKRIRPFLAF